MTSHKVLWKTGLIVITAGFVVSLCSKLGYWSIRTELTSISTPNWMRIRYIVFYAMPMAFMILHYLTNRNKKIESFYIFSCLLMAGQAGVRAIEYFKAGEKLLFTGLEALILIGFIICLAESQAHSKRRWLPLLIFFIVLVLHTFFTVRDTILLPEYGMDNNALVRLFYFLSECGLILFDFSAFTDLYNRRDEAVDKE